MTEPTTLLSIDPRGLPIATSASQCQAGPTCQADPAGGERHPVPAEKIWDRGLHLTLPEDLAGSEVGQERFQGEFGVGNRPEAALLHVQSDGPFLIRYRPDERAEDGAAVRMVVRESAIRGRAPLWISEVDRADHEQVIRVEDEGFVILTAALDFRNCPQPERHQAVAVDGRCIELDDFVVGRGTDFPEILRVFEQDRPAVSGVEEVIARRRLNLVQGSPIGLLRRGLEGVLMHRPGDNLGTEFAERSN